MTNEHNCNTCKNESCNYYGQREVRRVILKHDREGRIVFEMTPAEFTKNKGCTEHSDIKTR